MAQEKFVVYVGGGGMAGVYGAGVLKGIGELGLIDRIESIYAGSAGVLNVAYFLSGQHELGPRIYWEDLKSNFIFPRNVLLGTYDLFINRYVKNLRDIEVRNVIDIDHACSVVKNVKPLDLRAIESSLIDFYVKLLDIESGDIRYIRMQDHCSIDLIRAAINIKPYYFPVSYFDSKSYIDGTIKEPIGIRAIVGRHPNRKIIVILNEPIERGVRHYLKNFLEGSVAGLYPFKISLSKLFFQREKSLREDIEYCDQNESILIISPSNANRALPKTTDPDLLKHTFFLGRNDSSKIYSFLN